MVVKMRVFGYDIPDARNIEVTLAEGATVEDALRKYLEEIAIGLTMEQFLQSHFLINSVAGNVGQTLKDQDALTVMRLLGGG